MTSARCIRLQDITSGARVQSFLCDFRIAGFAHEEDFGTGSRLAFQFLSMNG
jgi:hypothetical protein